MTIRSWTPAVLLFAGLALFPFAASFGADAYLITLGARVLILALAALSLDFLVGQGALVSFGHAAYLGIGAYSVVLVSIVGVDDLLLQALVAVVAAAIFAALTGYVSLRASGVYYIMSTLAFGQMLYFLFVSLSALGGDDGYTLSSRSFLLGEPRLRSDISFYYFCLAVLVLAYVLLARIAKSRFGRVLNAIRQNRLRARTLGFRPFRFQLAACVIAGGIAAVAGTLLANQSEFVAPAFMSWQRSGELLVMTILGGVGSLWGAVLGAIVYLTLEEALSLLTDQTHLVLGPLLVAAALFGRRGLAGVVTARPLGGEV
ncbi:MAG TPA: branched-chain amino acid ABC transporter permease [Roseiarcus sp.]|jgi:branched-chain amino acid transport system permease protein